ncbi:hypothetical protein BsIDN1_09400 [Bacillus safensis]|uniref:SprT-like domain-containing protein n=1 Tax=Bacillus safensis TaxID=561879 RepID=A0A5S9M3J9_BACIA|nr:hypothetical protein BsIDN1_09400 [Bacillus safensis]
MGIAHSSFGRNSGCTFNVCIGEIVPFEVFIERNDLIEREKELQQLTEHISQQFFGKTFRHQAVFNDRLKTTGGRYLLGTHNIELNRRYLEEHGREELIGIIKHELCHYHLHLEGKGYQHRDRDFKALLKQVGAPRFFVHR